MMNEEQKYIMKIAGGDEKAFDSLFLLYHSKVKNFILAMVKKEDDALDITQDVFFKIWERRTSLTQIDSLSAYIFRMSKNAVYDYCKKYSSYDNYPLEDNYYKVESSELTDEIVEAKELELLIELAIENMPTQQKRIFRMSRKEGLSNDDIASELDISKRTVETHISNALKEIRKLLIAISVFFC